MRRWLLGLGVALIVAAGASCFTPFVGGLTVVLVVAGLFVLGSARFVGRLATARDAEALLRLECPRCGFDVRGQFHGGGETCPECGERLGLERWRS